MSLKLSSGRYFSRSLNWFSLPPKESLNETEQYLRKIEKELASLRSIWYLKLASKFTGGQTKRKKN